MSLTADCINKEVKIKQLGSNASQIGNIELLKGSKATLHHNDSVNFLPNKYLHKIIFKSLETSDNPAKLDSSLPRKITDFFGGKSGTAESPGKRKGEDTDRERKRAKMEPEDASEAGATGGHELSDDEDEHEAEVARQLELMRKMAAPSSSTKKEEKEATTKPSSVPECQGTATEIAEWRELGSLLVHISEGVRSSSKVKKETMLRISWQLIKFILMISDNTYVFCPYNWLQIAAFDIDYTIICTQSGRVFPTHYGDWTLVFLCYFDTLYFFSVTIAIHYATLSASCCQKHLGN